MKCILNSQSLDLGYQSGNGFFSFLVFVGSSYGFLYIIYGFWTRKKFWAHFGAIWGKTRFWPVLPIFQTSKSFFITGFFITDQKAISLRGLKKGIMLVKRIFFPSMLIIDFFPHLYWEVLCVRPILGAKNGRLCHDAQKPIEPHKHQNIHEFW